MESYRIDEAEVFADEDLTYSPQKTRLVAGTFNGLAADYYWMRALQYIGRKVSKSGSNSLDENYLRSLNPKQLYPMLDTATTLDPQFTALYTFGAMLLPEVDVEQAVKLCEKGITANPDDWHVYHNLGYILWQKGDFARAAQVYTTGATKPDAPRWMRQMTARMQAEGGSRKLAREIYQQVYDDAPDEQSKSIILPRLLQIQSLDERNAIRQVLQDFTHQNKRCPQNWRELTGQLRTVKLPNNANLLIDNNGAPLDPSATPYLLINQAGQCDVELNRQFSKIIDR